MKPILTFSLLIGSAMLLVACAKTDSAVIEASCNKTEDNKAFCSCFTEKMASVLPEETFTRIADGIRDGASSPQDAISKLSPTEQIQTLTVIPELFTCSTE